MKEIQMFTDGACSGNGSQNNSYGGWACILCYGEHRKKLQGHEAGTTNNRMEITAAIRGLEQLKEPCIVHVTSDSQYVIKGITEWLPGWKRRNWINSQRKPVENRDLWETLDALCQKHQVDWTWTKGHEDHPENNECDQAAVTQSQLCRSIHQKSSSS